MIIFTAAVSFLVYINIRDRRYEKKSVTESMSDRVWDELAAEREAALERARKFRSAIKKAGSNAKPTS